MYSLPAKNWLHHIHIPSRNSMVLRIGNLAHDSRFWLTLLIAALIVILVGLIIWAGVSGDWSQQRMPTAPFYPYHY